MLVAYAYHTHRLDEGMRASAWLPEALARIGYREPARGDMVGFNLAFDTTESLWEYMDHSDPKRGKNFASAMAAVKINKLEGIPQMYPFERLVHDGGVLVDVGGGMGQVSRAILDYNPNAGLSCVVQDSIVVTERSSEIRHLGGGNLTFQKHNFFDPQPVQGILSSHNSSCGTELTTISQAPQHTFSDTSCTTGQTMHASSSSSILYKPWINTAAVF